MLAGSPDSGNIGIVFCWKKRKSEKAKKRKSDQDSNVEPWLTALAGFWGSEAPYLKKH